MQSHKLLDVVTNLTSTKGRQQSLMTLMIRIQVPVLYILIASLSAVLQQLSGH